MFDDFFDEFERMFRESFASAMEPSERSYRAHGSVHYDSWEAPDKVYITVELPGASEKSINIDATPYRVIVQASRGEKENSYYVNIPLRSAIKTKPISKTFKNGVLELIFEKDLSLRSSRFEGNNYRKRIEVR